MEKSIKRRDLLIKEQQSIGVKINALMKKREALEKELYAILPTNNGHQQAERKAISRGIFSFRKRTSRE
jgi:cystathionine beta-lyase/cystathionine gamma-synthase